MMKQWRPNSRVVGLAMKAIMVILDSLNRHMLPPFAYEWVHAASLEGSVERAGDRYTAKDANAHG